MEDPNNQDLNNYDSPESEDINLPEQKQSDPLAEVETDKYTKGIEQTPEVKGPSLVEKATTLVKDTGSEINKATGNYFYTPRTDKLPTMEEFLGSNDYSIPKAARSIITGDFSNPDVNAVMDKTLTGRIVKHIGAGVYDAYNQGQLGIEPGSEGEKFFKDIGLFNDIQADRISFFRTAGEVFIRPLAVGIDAAWRTMQAAVGGFSGGIEQGAEEVGGPAPELAEWAMTDIPTLETIMPHIPKPSDISKATELGVNAGHEAYFGIDNPTKETMDSRINAAQETEALEKFVQEKRKEQQPKDIHTIAREIAPEVFGKYDDLTAKKEDLRNQINDLAAKRDEEFNTTPPHAEEIQKVSDDINTLLGKVNGVEERLTKKQTSKLEDLRSKYDDLASESTRISESDTPEMAKLRGELQKTDYAARDLVTEVSAAYREARSRMPEEKVEGSKVNPEIEKTSPEIKNENPEIAPEEGSAQTGIPIEKQLSNIQQDVSSKLVAVGRSAEEANAAAELVSAHYKSVSELGWSKGSAEELYNRDAPDIIAGKRRIVKAGDELTQSAKGKIRLATENAKATIKLFKSADASTFIHETGHHWLDEMMRYAKAEDAPAGLLKDVETVNKWLGVEKDEAITRRQHEKFARGFERYMMEGIAPSKELASVFAKFKKWLTDIYQTVQKLRAPITDDIRDVFDRLLSSNPEKTVIAPEEAALGEAMPSTSGVQPSEPASEAPSEVAAPPQGATPGKESAVEKVTSSIDKVEKGIKPTAAGENERLESNKNIDKSGGKYVDKAGNIRLDLLNVGEDVKQAIREAAERNNNFPDWTRGKITDAEAFALAESSGMKAQDLDQFQIGKAYTKEEIFQLQRLLNSASEDVVSATKALNEAKTDEARIDLAEKIERFRMIQDQVQSRAAGARAEAGRALQSLYAIRKMSGSLESEALANLLKDQTGFDLYQMDEIASAISELDSPGKVAGYLEEIRKPSNGDKLFEVFANWLISNPVTHAIYAKGNTILALYKATIETAGEAAVGAIRSAITGEKERVYFGEVNAQLYGIFKGQREGWSSAWKAFKTGQTIELPHEALDKLTKIQRKAFDEIMEKEKAKQVHEEGKSFGEVLAEARLKKGQRKIYTQLRKENKTFDEAIIAVGGVPSVKTVFTQQKAIDGVFGTLVRLPGERMVAPIHSYFRSIGYSQNIAKQAYHIAKAEGMEGYDLSKRVADLSMRPTEEMMTTARKEATEQTLMSGGGELTKRVSSLANWEKELPILGRTKPIRFIDPFLHIHANMLEQGVLRRSPLGLLSQAVMKDIRGENGILAQNKAIAQMSLGTSLMLAGGGLAMEGLLTPSAPSDPKEAAMWRMIYGMPHSFNIGDMSYDLQKLGPLGLNLGIAADLYHVSTMIGKEDAAKIASATVHSISKNFLDEGFLRGPSDFMQVMNNPDRYGERYIDNFVANLVVPYSMGTGQMARIIDPEMRQTRDLMDTIKAKVPWLSLTLPPLRDVWGEPVLNKEMGLLSYEKQVKEDPVNQRLYNLSVFPSVPRRQILGVELTDEQYDQYSKLAGRQAKQQLDSYVRLTEGREIPPGQDIKTIKTIISDSRRVAASIVAQNFPEIMKTAVANKQSILHTGKKANKQSE